MHGPARSYMERRQSGTLKAARKVTRLDSEGLWDWNLVSSRIHFSPGWMALIGCQDHEVGNAPDDWFQRVHPDDRDQLACDIEAARDGGRADFDLRYRIRHKDGTYRWMSSRGLVVRNDAGDAIRLTGTQLDVTVQTVTDPLTGLPNRVLLLDRLAQSIERARRQTAFHFALVLLDLGRPAGATQKSRPGTGDPMLNAAARRLETCLRTPELMRDLRQTDLVARLNGDLLAILLDGLMDLNHSKVVADRILLEMLEPFTLGGREMRLSPTIGIAVSATGYARAEEALRDAETALHRAQVLGGSHCEVFDAEVLKSEQSDLQLENDFELALERREFQLAFQPIVSLTTNQVAGFEALVRWHHPELGIIPPLDFIPIAERTGFIVALGHWTVQEACTQLRAWQTEQCVPRDLYVSVNVSGIQLREPEFVQQIEEALRKSDLPAPSLVLELTEGIAMDNPDAITTLLMRLRAMGVRISIDDFGTGYSSLAYVRQFPVDALKIDQSFVRGMENDSDTAAIVASMVSMARQLGLDVVAEGVSNEQQLASLRALDCDCVQGYFVGEPLSTRDAGEYLRDASERLAFLRGGEQPAVSAGAYGSRWHERIWSPTGRILAIAAAGLVVLASAGVAGLARMPAGIPAAPPIPRSFAHQVVRPSPGNGVIADVLATLTSGPAALTTSPPAPPVEFEDKSFEVVHLHRIGSCRGSLRVSATGIAFVPAEKGEDDAVDLKHAEFRYTADAETLTVRSAKKTYRFRAHESSTESGGALISDIESAISRARPK